MIEYQVRNDISQLQKIIDDEKKWYQAVDKFLSENSGPNTIYEPTKKVFIPIKTAEKLPLRSELSQDEFKCLTLLEPFEENNWTIQYLSGYYHKKSKTFYVKIIGDSYMVDSLYQNILLQGLREGKYTEYLLK
jgi:hypothetical protein